MTIKIQGDKITFPDDSEQTTAYNGSSGGGIPEAPVDGKQYGRQDATWTEVTGGGSGSGGKAIAFNALLTSAQTIPPSLKTTIFYDDIKLDTDSNYNSATGKYTIQSDGIYRIGASVNLKKDNSLIDALAYLNINSEVVQRNRFDFDASKASSSFMAVNIDYVADLKEGDEVYISAYGRTTDSSDIDLIGGADIGNVFNIIKVSGGGSGGSYTPEAMVWEDKTADREYGTVYTNTKDCPIYVQPYLERNSTDRMYVQFKIDGDLVWTEGGEAVSFSSPMFVVPSGSTYELEDTVTGTSLKEWFEANVSGGASSGGKTVTFRSGGVSAGQTAPPNTNYPIQFSTTADVNGGTWDGTYFTPDTAGWYQMSGSVFANAPTTSRVGCIIQKNDNSELATFNQGITAVGGGGVSTSGLVYCNGTTDKLSLVINCNDTLPTLSGSTNTVWFSAHLVSGGSSSGGDSIWTELGDVAIYDGDIQVNGVTVGQGSGTNDKNTALGISCLENTTGVQNTAVGFNSLIADTTGTRNTALGYASLNTLTEGEYNTAVGHVAGSSLITGNNNILIGHDAQPSAPDVNNEVTIGNASITGTRLRGNVYVENNTNTDIRALVPSGKYASLQVDNTDQKYSMQVRPDEGNAFVIRNETASQNTMSIATNGTVKFGTNMTIGNTGVISAQGINDTTTNAVAPNVCVDGSGVLRRSTVATYSAEEVDKKLAIKDKLIEKLSARLDELEKKVK